MVNFSRLALLAASLWLLLSAALAQDSVGIQTSQYHRQAHGGRCVIVASYPEVVGRPDLTAKIRSLLPQPVPLDDLDAGEKVTIEQDFQVTYNAKGLLSVYGTGLSMRTRNGEPSQAHPSKLFNGIVLDIRTAKAYSLRDLFGTDVHAKLEAPLSRAVAKELQLESPEPLQSHTYRAYLSPSGVTFYQLFDIHALSSLEVTLPYATAAKFRGPNSPLERFTKP